MHITISEIISTLIIGALAGSLAGMIFTLKKKGFGWALNLVLGIAGAILGSALVRLFKINFGLGQIVLRFEDLIAAIFVALTLLITFSFIRSRRKKQKKQ